MKDPLPFELLVIRSLISLAWAMKHPENMKRYIDPTLKELSAYERGFWDKWGTKNNGH